VTDLDKVTPPSVQGKAYYFIVFINSSVDYPVCTFATGDSPMPTRQPEADDYISASKLRRKMGGITAVTLWRWRQRDDFPRPVVINHRNYFSAAAIATWIAARELAARAGGRSR
jgi:predicted DNA-binding transcriptional regulator AlpA